MQAYKNIFHPFNSYFILHFSFISISTRVVCKKGHLTLTICRFYYILKDSLSLWNLVSQWLNIFWGIFVNLNVCGSPYFLAMFMFTFDGYFIEPTTTARVTHLFYLPFVLSRHNQSDNVQCRYSFKRVTSRTSSQSFYPSQNRKIVNDLL